MELAQELTFNKKLDRFSRCCFESTHLCTQSQEQFCKQALIILPNVQYVILQKIIVASFSSGSLQ